MCQGEETSLNNVLVPADVRTALRSQHRCWKAFSSSVHQLPYAKPATPLSRSPFPQAHKPMLPLHLHTVPWQRSTSLCQSVSGSQQHSHGAGPDLGNALVCVHPSSASCPHARARSNADPPSAPR